MSIETPDDSGAPERFTAKERDLIRREFRARWGGVRSLHEGFFLRRWGGGPQKGTPKVGATLRSMLARGLVEIVDPKTGFPCARFTPAGITALRAMAQHGGMLPPDQYGHLIEELETFPDPQGRRRRASKAAARSESVPETSREAAGRPPKERGKAARPVENSAAPAAFAAPVAGGFDGKPPQIAEIIPFPTRPVPTRPPALNVLYKQDFYAWTQKNAELLRAGRWDALDLQHLTEELESMGQSEKRILTQQFAGLLTHLLQWSVQANRRGRSGHLALTAHRRQILRTFRDNPSLISRASEIRDDAYEDALLRAAQETGLEESAFPAECPFALEQIFDENFLPD